MILLSLVLVVASAATLVWGVVTTIQALVWGSLAAGLAAVALVVGSVLRRRERLALDPGMVAPGAPPSPPAPTPAADPAGADRAQWPWSEIPGSTRTAPGQAAPPPPPAAGWTTPVPSAPPGPAAPPPDGEADSPAPPPDRPASQPSPPGGWDPAGAAPGLDRPGSEVVTPAGPGAGPAGPGAEGAGSEPAPSAGSGASTDDGEPAVEPVPVRDALRVAQLDDEVLVVDGHPRYHLAGCPTLAGALPVPLAVSVARRGGFTPCGVCAPDRTLLARSQDRRTSPGTG